MLLLPTLLLYALGLLLTGIGSRLASRCATWCGALCGLPMWMVGGTLVAVCTALPQLVLAFLAAGMSVTALAVGTALAGAVTQLGLVLALCLLRCNVTVDRGELLRSALDFSDVADSEYAQEIDSLAASRIVFGDGGKFRPDATMTRAEVCALLAQVLALYSTAHGYFTDVAKGSWYAPSVNAMAAIGLVSGVGGGKFDPNATMTQEEFITVLGRLVEFVNLDAREFLDKNPLAILQPLPKYKSFSHWAIRSAELLTNSVFDENGDAVNMYCMSLEDIAPQVPILREQAAAALYNGLRTTGVLKY